MLGTISLEAFAGCTSLAEITLGFMQDLPGYFGPNCFPGLGNIREAYFANGDDRAGTYTHTPPAGDWTKQTP